MDLSPFLNKCYRDCIFESDVPLIVKNKPCVLGIDEAGRGPVLGPMVYGLAYFPLELKDSMKKMNFADSKSLNEEKREKIFESIYSKKVESFGWIAKVLSPTTISNSMLKRSKYNLNLLSHDTAISLIKKAIEDGLNISEVYVDTVGPAKKYQKKLEDSFPRIKFIVAEKADSLYPVVSAASIIAKVIRDRIISNWKFCEKNIQLPSNNDYGSGYPGDPKTKDFLEKYCDPIFGFTSLVRFSWSTASDILDNKAIKCEWDDPKEQKIFQFLNAKNLSKITQTHNRFFNERCLTKVEKL